jgi:hypothetical protein
MIELILPTCSLSVESAGSVKPLEVYLFILATKQELESLAWLN